MLAIAQAGQQFHYFCWTPTTTKPVLNGYGVKSFDKTDLSSTDFFNSLFSELIEKYKLTTPRLQLSLDMDSVHLSETTIPDNTNFEAFQNWLVKTNYDSEFSKRFETFYYPFEKQLSKSLNIHISTKIKKSIISAIKINNAELRFLTLGIFAAESCIQSLYKPDSFKSYLIWRIGAFNFNEIIWIKNNNLTCFIRFKNVNNIYKIQNFYGCSKSTDRILKLLEKCKDQNFNNFNIGDRIYVYSISKSNALLNKILNSGNSKFQQIDISQKFNLIKENQNPFIFAETGIAFRGFDV